MTNVMKDLQQISFRVPLVDKYIQQWHAALETKSVGEIAKHAGIETVLRCTLSTTYVIEKREVMKKVKKDCHRCRLLAKRTVKASMGLVSDYNLTIAPAFYYTQEDFAGPFKAYTFHIK